MLRFSSLARDSSHPAPRVWPVLLRVCACMVALAPPLVRAIPAEWSIALDPIHGGPFTILRSHGLVVNFDLMWALSSYRGLAPWKAWLPGIAAVLLACLPRSITDAIASVRLPGWLLRTGPRSWACTAAALALCASRLYPVKYELNQLYGDGSMLHLYVGASDGVFAAEIVTMHMFRSAQYVLEKLHAADASPLSAIRWVDSIAGAVFFGSLAAFARGTGRGVLEGTLLFLGTSCASYTLQFFGYVETTQVETALIALYFTAAAASLRTRGPGIAASTLIAVFALSTATMAHGAGLLLLPSAAFLLADLTALGRRGPLRVLGESLRAENVALVFTMLLVPHLLIVVVPFHLRGMHGNAAGGGDGIMFVPATIDYAQRASAWVYYARFTRWHLADVANALWISAPLALPLLGVAFAQRIFGRFRFTWGESRLLALLGTAAALSAIIPLLWNHDFGVWGDWNLSATYLLPLNALAWLAFVYASRRRRRGVHFYVTVGLPLLIAQATATLGIAAQLYG
ncbi:MAG: hypothetical protein JWN48_5798 [Myxococcaceae bacterium]|nr:hypothetical protein [Myxococcaceae bacterium]